jgi:hypothetical protein
MYYLFILYYIYFFQHKIMDYIFKCDNNSNENKAPPCFMSFWKGQTFTFYNLTVGFM